MRLSLAILALPVALPAQTNRIVPTATYPTIQSAIDASSNADTVSVIPGIYNEDIDFKGKDIHVRAIGSGRFAGATIRGTGTGSVVTFISGESRKAILEGFAITGGVTTGSTAYGAGIRIELASPTIRGCRVYGNTAGGSGGGIGGYATSNTVNTEALIEDCVIERNKGSVSHGGGGGIGFVAVSSGAIRNRHVIRRCIIRDNEGPARGAGLYMTYGHGCLIDRCVFARNTLTGTANSGHFGGAAINFSLNCRATITNTLFFGNTGGVDGGGIKVFNTTGVRVVNSTFWGNQGGSISAYNNAGVFNTPTGIEAENCVLWQNGGSELVVTSATTNSNPTIAIANSDVSFTGWNTDITRSGTILNVDPQLANPRTANGHILPTSPCINRGNNAAADLPATDLDGGARTVGAAVDMGADEFLPTGCILFHDQAQVSVANPGIARFTVMGGGGRGGFAYALVPGLSGTHPGVDVAGMHFPLNLDAVSQLFIVAGLNASGTGVIPIPMTGLSASAIGLEVWWAAAITGPAGFDCFTNGVSLEVVQ